MGTGSGIRVLSWLTRAGITPAPFAADMARRTLTAAIDNGWKVFFLGGHRNEVFNFAHQAPKRHPGLKIVGALEGLKSADDEAGARRLIERLNDSGADIILGSPRTPAAESFTLDYRDELTPRIVVNLWGGFDARLMERLTAPVSTIPGFVGLAMRALRS